MNALSQEQRCRPLRSRLAIPATINVSPNPSVRRFEPTEQPATRDVPRGREVIFPEHFGWVADGGQRVPVWDHSGADRREKLDNRRAQA